MRKDISLTVTLDATTADQLRRLAESSTDGNRSLVVRQLVRREAAERRGLWPVQGQPSQVQEATA